MSDEKQSFIGRPRGSLNKRSLELKERIAAEIGDDFDPVLTLARFAADENNTVEFRAACSEKVAPYIHARLKHVESTIGFDPNGLVERIQRGRARARMDDDIHGLDDRDQDAILGNVDGASTLAPGEPQRPTARFMEAPHTDTPEMARASQAPAPEPYKGNPKWRPSTSSDLADVASVDSNYEPHE